MLASPDYPLGEAPFLERAMKNMYDKVWAESYKRFTLRIPEEMCVELEKLKTALKKRSLNETVLHALRVLMRQQGVR